MKAIDGDALLERACNLEAQALAYVGKIANDESKIEEWKIWSAILAERTAFKHDVFDAPTIEPERKKGKWIDDGSEFGCCCSECCETLDDYFDGALYEVRMNKIPNFCPNCGADLRGDNDD